MRQDRKKDDYVRDVEPSLLQHSRKQSRSEDQAREAEKPKLTGSIPASC